MTGKKIRYTQSDLQRGRTWFLEFTLKDGKEMTDYKLSRIGNLLTAFAKGQKVKKPSWIKEWTMGEESR